MQNESENLQIIEVQNMSSLEAVNRSEINMQISTAKQYPRDIESALRKIKYLATMDEETAQDCFYALKRGGDTIEGISVRMAEIIASSWGNLRVQTRITANDGRTITATGICHDLESNLAISVEVKRRITDRFGKTFSDDLQVLTGNAASAIAFRNALLKVVPKAVTKKAIEEVKNFAIGKSMDVEKKRKDAIKYFSTIGITVEQILEYLDLKTVDEIEKEQILSLGGLVTALKEGTTTLAEAFPKKVDPKTDSKELYSSAKKVVEKIEGAMNTSEQPTTLFEGPKK